MPKKRERVPLIPERLAARLWQQREWRRARRTLDGRRLRVLYPGRRNGGSGPDFKDALVQRDASPLVRGDIEVHLRVAGWSQHGHHRDPRYNNVVLHVVVRPDAGPSTYRQDGQAVPVTELAPAAQPSQDLPQVTPVESPLPCLLRWRALSQERLGQLLDQAGTQRFLNKSIDFLSAMEMEDAEEVLYQGILESLGYSRNREPMLELARRLPWRTVRDVALAAPRYQRNLSVRRLLLAVSGLSGRLPEDPEDNESGAVPLEGVRGTNVAAMDLRAWCFAGVRPFNQPHRRLAGAAALLVGYLDDGLLAGLLPLARQKSVATLRNSLIVADEGGALIGQSRSLDMAVNVVLPALHAWGRREKDQPLADSCLGLYVKAPRLAENEITREMEELLGVAGSTRGAGAMRQQGLLHLYQVLLETPGPSQLPKARAGIWR
ncbi:MAG: DUF2851 family protein [Dehalococcoidia bacterium]|nr:DUF2851 family protein [Dehalococcoidia bacterium]